jgi:transcriptional regulator with XRE-family HTH domain
MKSNIPDPPDAVWLRALLARHGVSQCEAARRIHVPPSTLRRWLSPPSAKQHRHIPWAYARALVAEVAKRQSTTTSTRAVRAARKKAKA